MAWRRPGDKPLSEPMLVSWLTHICVTRPQWVKAYRYPCKAIPEGAIVIIWCWAACDDSGLFVSHNRIARHTFEFRMAQMRCDEIFLSQFFCVWYIICVCQLWSPPWTDGSKVCLLLPRKYHGKRVLFNIVRLFFNYWTNLICLTERHSSQNLITENKWNLYDRVCIKSTPRIGHVLSSAAVHAVMKLLYIGLISKRPSPPGVRKYIRSLKTYVTIEYQ